MVGKCGYEREKKEERKEKTNDCFLQKNARSPCLPSLPFHARDAAMGWGMKMLRESRIVK